MMLPIVTLVMLCMSVAWSVQVTLPRANIQILQPKGIKFSIADVRGMSLIGLHFSINEALLNVSPGKYNVDIRSKTGNEWIYENRNIDVKPGDTVNYWLNYHLNGLGLTLLEQAVVLPTTETTTVPPTVASTDPSTGSTTVSPNPTDPFTTSATNAPNTTVPPGDTCSKYPCLVFEDNFNTLNFSLWQHEITATGGGNWEFEYYLNNRSNSYVKDGHLYIKPTLTTDRFGETFLSSGTLDLWGGGPANLCTGQFQYGCFRVGTGTNYINPIQSARLRTSSSFNFKYGKVEVKAKMPTGDWIWPAIWMLPISEEYGIWPASGEIDIVEARGNKNLKSAKGENIGIGQMCSTMHWGPYYGQNGFEKTHFCKEATNGDFASDFHKYGVEWDEDHVSFYLDEQLVGRVDPGDDGFWKYGGFDKLPKTDNPWQYGSNKMTPFDKEFYIIMNVAVGGTNGFFPEDAVNAGSGKPWRNTSPTADRDFWMAKNQWYPTWNADKNNGEDAAMAIDYMRVWKLKP